jgi:hypothetical protein
MSIRIIESSWKVVENLLVFLVSSVGLLCERLTSRKLCTNQLFPNIWRSFYESKNDLPIYSQQFIKLIFQVWGCH